MVKKILGYLLAVIGIAGLASAVIPQIGATLALPDIGETNLMITSVALVLIGVFLAFKKGDGRRHRGGTEVPIYHGSDIVGYRRT